MGYTLCLLFLLVDAAITVLCVRELIRRGWK